MYRGRFAPSPTGPLHFGSLVAAVGSYLDARRHGGQWLVRMEDVDAPRCVLGADVEILRTLETFGFAWDGPVLYQSSRMEAYRAALAGLTRIGRVFPCACTRKEIADSATGAPDTAVRYPGTCREGLPTGREPRALRFRTEPGTIHFHDRLHGPLAEDVAAAIGDFIVLRADGVVAYQLAVVVDDAFQGITDVVRGSDLLDSTARQIALQEALGFPRPRYLHLPIVRNAAGEKLSKQTRAEPLRPENASRDLANALTFLGHPPPPELARATPAELWHWAL